MLYRDVTSMLTMVGMASEATSLGTGCVVMRSNLVCPVVMTAAFGGMSVRAASGNMQTRDTSRHAAHYI